MGFPKGETVASLLNFLHEQLTKGNVSLDTQVSIEIYGLSKEEEILKPHEEDLDYHVPDEIADECLAFRIGVWQCAEEGKSQWDDGAAKNYVALSCYVRPSSPLFQNWARNNPPKK